jgi:predicted  nucleic acid-binding Zn-ribbon protein
MPASLGEISVEMVRDMETTNNELADLEDELEIQKEAIQKQIVNACDASERSSSSLAEIEEQEVPPSITSLLTRLSFLTSADLVGESGSVGTLGD